jgi:hypothetical protein
VVGVIERAVARGEIPPPADVDVASGLIRSYAFERWLLWDEILSEASIDVLVPMLERALGHC